ncbi:MAG: Glutathione transport system permease protein GsiC [Pseudomonadota bacterium]|jgi:peptide/nickel transport system permease protein
MFRYILRRLMIAVPSLLGISLVLFSVLAMAPGDPFSELVSNPNIPPEVAMALREKFGLNDPLMVRYWNWLTAMVQGDWGYSFISRINVETLILQRIPVTLLVIGSSQLLALCIAIPVGVYAATKPYSLFDQIASTLAFIGFSLPTFFTGILLILFFSIHLDWLPFVYRADISETGFSFYWEHFKQMIMPVTVLGLFQAGAWTRYVRSAVLDVIRLDYVTTARSKGLAEKVVITKHVLRNALIPVVTLVALQMPAIFGGAIVTEQIFRIPGIGSLIISSMLANDTPVVMAVTFVFSTFVIACNLLADILYGWLDPRISFN